MFWVLAQRDFRDKGDVSFWRLIPAGSGNASPSYKTKREDFIKDKRDLMTEET